MTQISFTNNEKTPRAVNVGEDSLALNLLAPSCEAAA